MAKKKNDDRKAKIEALRKEQQRKEQLRTWGVLGVSGVLVVALLSFAVTKYVKDSHEKKRLASVPLSSIGVKASAASCDPEKTEDASGSGQHIPPPQVITYPTAPPAFGEHWGNFLSGSELRTFYTRQDTPEIERLVHSLEHGHTIIWYDDTIKAGSADYQALQKITARLGLDSYVFAAPYITKDDGGTFPAGKHIVMSHWTGPDAQKGVWQYCGKTSGSVISDFINKYPKDDAPEPGAA